MQDVINDGIRWLGYGALMLATLGRYRGGRQQDELVEGGVGLGLIVLISGTAYAF
jgi:hypothetical protein